LRGENRIFLLNSKKEFYLKDVQEKIEENTFLKIAISKNKLMLIS
jgi:hypothetical protein